MSGKNSLFKAFLAGILVIGTSWATTVVPTNELAKKLLYGDKYTRLEAIKEFNKLPPDVQYKLVPDFMVAMSDDDPEVRKIAGRILKAMGVKSVGQIPDAKDQVTPNQLKAPGDEKWVEEKKLVNENQEKWGDLKKMRQDSVSNYADMKAQIDQEKNGQVSLDAAQLLKDAPEASSASPLASVTASLKDPDPWVRAQAARRLAMIHPAPMEALPDLIKMLGDKEPESRRAAVAALGSFGHLAKDALIPLNAALSDPDPAVRQLATDSIKLIKQEP